MTGYELKFLRENNKLTQNECADKLHVSRQTISKWERGEVPISDETADEIYKQLQLTEEQQQQLIDKSTSLEVRILSHKMEDLQSQIEKMHSAQLDQLAVAQHEKNKTIFKSIIIAALILVMGAIACVLISFALS